MQFCVLSRKGSTYVTTLPSKNFDDATSSKMKNSTFNRVGMIPLEYSNYPFLLYDRGQKHFIKVDFLRGQGASQ